MHGIRHMNLTLGYDVTKPKPPGENNIGDYLEFQFEYSIEHPSHSAISSGYNDSANDVPRH